MSHLRIIHNITPTQLLEKYPNTKLVSDSVKNKASKSCINSNCGRPSGCVLSDEHKQKISVSVSGEKNPFYGKHHSDTTKQRMSKNHADFTGNKNPLVKWLNKDPKNKDEYSNKCIHTWTDPKNYENLCQSNRKNIVKAMLNGNHNPYSNCDHGWIFSQKFGNKFYYQSSYEKRFIEFCETFSKIGSLQRMPFVIPYVDSKGKIRNYFADFLINQTIVVEIKPQSMLNYNNNKYKIDAGKKYCLEHGYEYKLLMENELNNLEKIL
jgi:hypothetical protein